jgi:hypothetical protein
MVLFVVKVEHCVVDFLSIFSSKPSICHPLISNCVATCPSPSSSLLPLPATPYWLSFNVY